MEFFSLLAFGFIHFEKKKAFKGPLVDVMLHSENCSEHQMASKTHRFVDRTFQRSN